MKGLYTRFKELPALIQLVIITILIYLAWRLYVAVKMRLKTHATTATTKSELNALKENGVKPSYSDSAYNTWADELEKAMDGPGTTMSVINKVFGYLKNDADWVKLYQAFGLRSARDNLFGLIAPSDLLDWLRNEKLVMQARGDLNRLLKSKGISKQI